MKKNIKRVLIGKLISSVADGFFSIALPLYFYEITNSLFDLGLFFMLIKIPSMLLTPYIGVLVEKINKKCAVVLCDYLSGLLFGLLAVCYLFKINSIVILSVIAAIYTILGSVFSISSSVLFTQLTDENNRLQFNAKKSLLDNIASLAAPALGTVLYSIIGMTGIAVINAILFTASATAELFIEYDDALNDYTDEKLTIKDYKTVFGWLKSNQNVFKLLFIVMLLNFFVGSNEEVLFPGILVGKHNINTAYYGISTTIFIAGSLVSSILITLIKDKNKLRLKRLFITNSALLAMIGVFSILLNSFDKNIFYIIYLVLMFFVGIITTSVNVPLSTEFQTQVPVSIQGRFFATLSLISSFLIPFGIFVAGITSNAIGCDITIVLYNLIVIAFVALIIPKSQVNISPIENNS